MRTKLLRGKEGVTVQLLYPSTLDEYRQVLDALGGGRPAVATGVAALRSRQIPAGERRLRGHDGAAVPLSLGWRALGGGPGAKSAAARRRCSVSRVSKGGLMATSFRLVPGAVTRVSRLRPASEVSVERENARFLESALVALVGSIRASRVQVLKDLADLEDRASGALDLAVRVREAVEAGGLASPESRVSTEWDLTRVGSVLRGREAGAHRSIAFSAAGTVEAAFEVACFAAGRHLSADL